MAFTQNPNSGSLFKNDRKEKENHPDYKGSALVDGREYWVAAWIKKSKAGKTFMSMSYQLKDEQTKQVEPGPTDLDDEIPF